MVLAATGADDWLVALLGVLTLVGTLGGAYVGPMLTGQAAAKREKDARRDAFRAAVIDRQLADLRELQEALNHLFDQGCEVVGTIVSAGRVDRQRQFRAAQLRVVEVGYRVRSADVAGRVDDALQALYEMTSASDLGRMEECERAVTAAHVAMGKELVRLEDAALDPS